MYSRQLKNIQKCFDISKSILPIHGDLSRKLQISFPLPCLLSFVCFFTFDPSGHFVQESPISPENPRDTNNTGVYSIENYFKFNKHTKIPFAFLWSQLKWLFSSKLINLIPFNIKVVRQLSDNGMQNL